MNKRKLLHEGASNYTTCAKQPLLTKTCPISFRNALFHPYLHQLGRWRTERQAITMLAQFSSPSSTQKCKVRITHSFNSKQRRTDKERKLCLEEPQMLQLIKEPMLMMTLVRKSWILRSRSDLGHDLRDLLTVKLLSNGTVPTCTVCSSLL